MDSSSTKCIIGIANADLTKCTEFSERVRRRKGGITLPSMVVRPISVKMALLLDLVQRPVLYDALSVEYIIFKTA